VAFATLQEDREAKCKAKINAVCADSEGKRYDPCNWAYLLDYNAVHIFIERSLLQILSRLLAFLSEN
jgi:hypothetical protein